MSNITGISQPNNAVLLDGRQLRTPDGQEKPIQLKPGTSIQGTVVSISDVDGEKIANINVGDAVISAKLADGMGLREGQTLNFSVKTASQKGVTLLPLYENTSIDQSTLKALVAAGIEVNNDTVSMVKEMMEAGLPIDKDSLIEMNKNLSSYPNTSISTMVEMKSLGIPINENNIEQYTNYKNYEHQVTSQMQEIVDELPKAFDNLIQSGNTKEAVNLYGNMLKLFAEGAEVATADGEQVAETVTGSEVQAQNLESGKATEALTSNEAPLQENGDVISVEAKEQNVASQIQKDAGESSLKAEASLSNNRSETGALGGKVSNEFIDSLKNLNISEKAVDDFAKAIKTGNMSEADATKLLFKELANAFEKSDLSNPVETAAWKKLFTSDEFGKLQKENISNQWLLKPLDVEKKENIDNLYQRLGNQAKALSETINNTFGADSKLGQAANNLSNNLDFMNQLNQMFQYVQLPLQMTGQNVHGDLYVYQNKHRKMSEDGSVSAILHLDMENLGAVDVYVKLIDTKVTTNFYVEDDSVLDLINDNIHILNERLEKRGYQMQVNLHLQDEIDTEDAAVDEMLNINRRQILSTNSFDARA